MFWWKAKDFRRSETLSLLQCLYVFVNGSSVHQRWVHLQKEQSLSDTQWLCQASIIIAFCAPLEIILSLLNDIIDTERDWERVVNVGGLLNQTDKPFLRILIASKLIFVNSKCVSDFLQSPSNEPCEVGYLFLISYSLLIRVWSSLLK